MRKAIYLIFLSLFPFILFAADGDTSLVKQNNINVDSVRLYMFSRNPIDYLDTTSFIRIYPYSLDGFQDYKYSGKLNDINLGNWGTAAYSPFFELGNWNPFVFMHSMNEYSLPENYYTTNKPFTSLRYANGMKKEQTFDVFHTQNFSPTWNVMLGFYKINSVGFYDYQMDDHTLIRFNTHFLSKSKRWSVVANFRSRKISLQENGGLVDMNSFDSSEFSDPTLYETRLNRDSNQASNEFKMLKGKLNLGYHFDSKNREDTIHPRQYQMAIGLNSSIKKGSREYLDENASNFYANCFIDTAKTDDLNATLLFDNGVYYSFKPNDKFKIKYNSNFQYNHYEDVKIDTNYENIYNSLKIVKQIGQLNRISLFGKYVFSGYNQNDYNARLEWKYNSMKTNGSVPDLLFFYTTSMTTAPIFYQHYYSNHFEWQNDFEKRQINEAHLDLYWPHFKTNLILSAGNIKGLVYFDEFALPRQFDGYINFFITRLKNRIRLGDFHLNNIVAYQSFDQAQLIPLPKLMDKATLFYGNYLFKKKLKFHIGLSCFIYSKSYGYAYMPATSSFYLQNDVMMGNYPYADFFISFRIERFKAMIKYEHFNTFFSGRNYIEAPNYPNSPAAVKVELSWAFLD